MYIAQTGCRCRNPQPRSGRGRWPGHSSAAGSPNENMGASADGAARGPTPRRTAGPRRRGRRSRSTPSWAVVPRTAQPWLPRRSPPTPSREKTMKAIHTLRQLVRVQRLEYPGVTSWETLARARLRFVDSSGLGVTRRHGVTGLLHDCVSSCHPLAQQTRPVAIELGKALRSRRPATGTTPVGGVTTARSAQLHSALRRSHAE